MKIDGLKVEEFASGEHTGLERRGIDGDHLLFQGGSRTGKTLTFNAILYCLLGSKETIDLSTGRSNRVKLKFTDGIRFTRGQPQAEYEDGDDQYESDEAEEELYKRLGDLELVKQHFLHSHIDNLPLNTLSKEDRLRIIRQVTNIELEHRIQRFSEARDQLEGLVQESEDGSRRYQEQLEEAERQISDLESQAERHQNLLDRIESGELERVRDRFLEDQELKERLDDLFDRKEDLRQRLRKKHRLKRKHENLSEEVRTVIAEAVNDFVCPTCDRRISTEKAESRIKQGYCPYCGREHSLEELKEDIRGRIDNSEEILEQLEVEIEELSDERSEVQSEIESIQEERPELSGLDSVARRKLKNNDFDIDAVREDVEEELENTESSLEELREEKTELEEAIEEATEKLETYQDALSHASTQVEELKQESFEIGVAEFTATWEEIYQEISDVISLEINVNEDGEIQLPGRNTLREYDSDGDLSSSEVLLLNFSFAYTLNQYATENGLINWETFVLDEPLDNMDEDSREEVLEFLQDSDRQFIITSSNEDLRKAFDQVEKLERELIQAELDRWMEAN